MTSTHAHPGENRNSIAPAPGAGLSQDWEEELQRIPHVPGWKPEWLRFVKTKAQIRRPGDIWFTYEFDQITTMMHEEFGPETHELTAEIVARVYRDHLQPAELRAQEGSSSTHHPDLAGPTVPVAGGSNEQSHSAHGRQHWETSSNHDSIHRAPPPNVHSAIAEGQAGRHEQPEADHSGANSSYEALQAGNGVQRLHPPLTNETLPSDMLHDLLSLGRNANRSDWHTMPTLAGMEQGLPPSRSAPSAPSILAPSYASAGIPYRLASDQPHQRAPRLRPLIPQEGGLDNQRRHALLDWYHRGFSEEARMRSRPRKSMIERSRGLPPLRPR